MATLTYLMVTSVDGYTTSPDGTFDWSEPSEANHRHAAAFASGLAGEIYGPRMWETMRVWQDIRPGDGNDYGDLAGVMYEYGELWRSKPHHVFSRAEGKPLTREALRELKAASDGELGISGPGLAAEALRWGEVDEVARYVVPHVTGGGTPWWPLGLDADLELTDHQELDAGWVFLRYRVVR
jgi:dihydrofolate reductase